MNDDWKRRRSGPQYLNANGSFSSFGSERPQYLQPFNPPPPIPKPQGIRLSEEAARKIAEAIKIFLREPSKSNSPRRR